MTGTHLGGAIWDAVGWFIDVTSGFLHRWGTGVER